MQPSCLCSSAPLQLWSKGARFKLSSDGWINKSEYQRKVGKSLQTKQYKTIQNTYLWGTALHNSCLSIVAFCFEGERTRPGLAWLDQLWRQNIAKPWRSLLTKKLFVHIIQSSRSQKACDALLLYFSKIGQFMPKKVTHSWVLKRFDLLCVWISRVDNGQPHRCSAKEEL